MMAIFYRLLHPSTSLPLQKFQAHSTLWHIAIRLTRSTRSSFHSVSAVGGHGLFEKSTIPSIERSRDDARSGEPSSSADRSNCHSVEAWMGKIKQLSCSPVQVFPDVATCLSNGLGGDCLRKVHRYNQFAEWHVIVLWPLDFTACTSFLQPLHLLSADLKS